MQKILPSLVNKVEMKLVLKFVNLPQLQSNSVLYSFYEAHKVQIYLMPINLNIDFVFFYNQN